MVDISTSVIVSFFSVVVSVIALYRTIAVTTDSRRGIVLQQYCEIFRNSSLNSNVLKQLYLGTADNLSLYEKLMFLQFYKELFLLIQSNNRMKREVASFMFAKYAEDILNCDNFWNPHMKRNCLPEKEKIQLKLFVDEVKQYNIKTLTI